MLRFLRKIRKGFKKACLTAAVVTCWQVGQITTAQATTLRFSGTVSPTVNSLSHLYLIYGTGYSELIMNRGVVGLGDFPSGQSTPFSVLGALEEGGGTREFSWFLAGLYGDISSGQYVEGLNGVTLGINASAGQSWASYFSINEEIFFEYLLNGETDNFTNYSGWWEGWHRDYDSYLQMDGTSSLFNFSQASDNGTISITSESVPEPVTIISLGTGGIWILLRRRDKRQTGK